MGEWEPQLTSVASSSSPVTIPGTHGAGGSSHGSSQQQMPQRLHLEIPLPWIYNIYPSACIYRVCVTVFVCPPSSGTAGAVGSGVQSQYTVPRVLLSAAATPGSGSQGRVLALQNRGHQGFMLAPSKQGRGARQGRPGKVPGDRARSDPFLHYTHKQGGDMASL